MTRNPKDIPAETTSSPDVRAHGGGRESPASPSLLARLRDSVWAPIVLKAGGGCIALCALGLLGAASLHARPGVELAPAVGEWVAQADDGAAPLGAQPSDAPASLTAPTGSGEVEPSAARPPGATTGTAPAPCTPTTATGPAASPAPSGGVLADGRVVLNLATADEFLRLPGIGPSKAQAIVDLRARLKKFRRVTDLLRVRGIGPKNLKRLQPLVVVDAPPPNEGAEAGAGSAATPPGSAAP